MAQTDNWSHREIVAQCIMPRLNIESYIEDENYKIFIHKLIDLGVGGFCIFTGNIDQVSHVIGSLQSRTNIPLLFSADFEHGVSMRLSDGTAFPHAMALGKVNDTETTRKIASGIADETKSLGVNWNFAPVCDVNSNPNNPIINIRSFGENSDIVSKHAIAYIEATQAKKVISTAKHFPGHGDSDVDSHLHLPILNHSIEKMESEELIPFRDAIKSNVRSIMIAHLLCKAYDEEFPASLSKKIITDLLIDKMGFRGLVVSDALDMKAISNTYSSGQAATLAAKAGINVILMPDNPEEVIEHLEKTVVKDKELLEKLKESAEKIYKEKRWCGLIPQFARASGVQHVFMENMNLALKVAHKALDIEGPKSVLPLNDDLNFAAFSILQKDTDMQAGSRFFTMLAQAVENDCDFGFIDSTIDDEEIDQLKEGIEDAQLIVFAYFFKGSAYHGSVNISDKINRMTQKLADGRPVIAIFFGSPYVKEEVDADIYIQTYSDSISSIAAAIVELSGRSTDSLDQKDFSQN